MSLPTEQKDMELTFKGNGRFNDTTLQECRGSDHAVALTAHGRVFTWGQLFGSIHQCQTKRFTSLDPARLEACTSFGLSFVGRGHASKVPMAHLS